MEKLHFSRLIFLKKLIGFICFRGGNFRDTLLVFKEKILYVISRISEKFFKTKPSFIGAHLNRDIFVKNSYGIFYCRKKEPDLHLISDSHEFKTKEVFKKIALKSDVIVDLGSNIGKYTILASKLSDGKIISIEASKNNFNILLKNIQLNNAKNVIPLNFAVGNKNTSAKLFDVGSTAGYSLKNNSKKYKIVNVRKLDSTFKDLKLKKIDLIKMDVEGAELDALKGCEDYLKNKKISNIIIEIYPDFFPKVRDFLSKYGYKLKQIEHVNFLAYIGG